MYDCRHIVTIEMINAGGTFNDKSARNPEYVNLLDNKVENFRSVISLKPEVLAWLEENVKNREDEEQPKGWCIGSPEYIAIDTLGFAIFFHRQTDARAFAKKWAKHGTFDSYFDYFNDIRRKYCPKKKRLAKEVRE